MSKFQLGPKLTELPKTLTFPQFETWKGNILYHLSLNEDFRPYLQINFGKKTKHSPLRNLRDDTEPGGATAETKCIIVDQLLEQLSNWTLNIIPRNDVTRDCASLEAVWQKLRLYYNMESTGSLLNEVWNIVREPDETPQALYSRLKQMYDDNLLRANGLHHVDGPLAEDEELSPTLHNTIILHWLNILHPKLRDVVSQRFATELRNSTYAKIFPEISRCINELLLTIDSESVCRTFGSRPFTPRSRDNFEEFSKDHYRDNRYSNRDNFRESRGRGFNRSRQKWCEYCKIGGRKFYQGHDTSECSYLRRDNVGKSRAMDFDEGEVLDESFETGSMSALCGIENLSTTEHVLNRVSTCASPVLPLYHKGVQCNLTLDSGATLNVMRGSKARQLGLKIRPTTLSARISDRRTPLRV